MLRFPLVLGPGNFIPREEFVLNRLLDGETILLPGDGQAVHQYVHITHAATALARAAELSAPGFTAYNVASERCNTSLEGFVQICAEVAGVPARTRTVGGGPTGEDLPVFDGSELRLPVYQREHRGRSRRGPRGRVAVPFLDLHEMIAQALAFLLENPQRRQWTRTAAEQRVLARLSETATR